MIKIIPAINADTFEKVREKVDLVEKTANKTGIKWVQVDVADGTLTKNTLWHDPKDLTGLRTSLKMEIHLMVNELERSIEDWLAGGTCEGNAEHGVCRIIFHLGASKDPDFVISRCKDYGKDVGIAISENESVAKALSYKDRVDFFQILSVRPGLPGQKMLEGTVEKIKEIKKACPDCIIEVDGGVNLENAKELVDAGANILVAASAVFKDGKIVENVKALKNEINNS